MQNRGPVPMARSLTVLALIIIAVGLAMSNLIPAEGDAMDTGTAVQDVVEVIIMVLMALGLAVMAWLLLRHLMTNKRGPRVARPGGSGGPLGLLLLLVIVAIVLLALPRAVVDSGLFPPDEDNGMGGGDEEPPVPVHDDEGSGSNTGFMMSVLALAAAFFLLLFLRAYGRRTGTSDSERAGAISDRAEEAAVIADLREEIVTGGDVRQVILAAYRRMLRFQSGAHPSLTAHELASLLVQRRGWPSTPTNRLTHLFEEAKYSPHPLGEEHRREALDSLGRIEDWLKGGAAGV